MDRLDIALGDALATLIDHRGKTPKKLGGSWQQSGVRVISAINIKDGRVDSSNLRYVSRALYERWMPEPLQRGDVLLTSEAPLGEVAYLSSDLEACLGQRLFALRGRRQVLHGRYLYYLLRWGPIRAQLLGRASGTTVSGIRQAELVKVKLSLPSMRQQRAVADVLGAIDDKIELNGRLVVTLRDLARSELAAAPQDAALRIGDIAEVRRGLAYTSAGLGQGGVPMINLANASDYGWLKRSGTKPYAGQFKDRHIAHSGSLLIAGVEQTWSNEILGWPLLVPGDYGLAVFSQDLFLIDFNDAFAWSRLPVWSALFDHESRAHLESHVYGSTVARVPREAIENLTVRLPRSDSVAIDLADSLLNRAWAAETEAMTLAAARDTLMAPLLAGRIRVLSPQDHVQADA